MKTEAEIRGKISELQNRADELKKDIKKVKMFNPEEFFRKRLEYTICASMVSILEWVLE